MGGSGLSISLVIPTLNAGRGFATLLHRLKGQGRLPLEILVLDCGSRDGTRETLLQFPEVRLVELSGSPGPAGWNRGCEEARGDLVVFIGQDALPANGDWLNHLAAPFEDDSVAGVYGRQEASATSSPLWNFRMAHRFCRKAHWRRLKVGDPIRHKSLPFFIENAAVRRSVWQGIHFNENLPVGADRVWARQAVLASYTVAYSPEALVTRELQLGLRAAFELARQTAYVDRQFGEAGGTLWPDSRRFSRKAAWFLISGFAWGALPYLLAEDLAQQYGYVLGQRMQRPISAVEGLEKSTLWPDGREADDLNRAA